jgi:hypothetical protein
MGFALLAGGERHRSPSAAVLENAEAKLRLCRIARCDPGEGDSQRFRSAETPPHPKPPLRFGFDLSPHAGRGEKAATDLPDK